jgi:hypothetical protein
LKKRRRKCNLKLHLCSHHSWDSNLRILTMGILPWVDFINNFHPALNIYALRSSFVHKFTLIWHNAFAPCAQFIAFFPDLGALYAFYRGPNFNDIHLLSIGAIL